MDQTALMLKNNVLKQQLVKKDINVKNTGPALTTFDKRLRSLKAPETVLIVSKAGATTWGYSI